MQGDGLPHQICTQCLRDVNKAFCFKQKCEKSDTTLRNYLQNLNFTQICDISNEISTNTDMLAPNDILPSCNGGRLMNSCSVMSSSTNLLATTSVDINAISTSMSAISNTIAASMNSLENYHSFTDIESNMNQHDLFGSNEVLQQSSLFQDIFSDPTNQSLVDNFSTNQANAGKFL